MKEFTINSRRLGPVTFSRPGKHYLFTDLGRANGYGTLGFQLCTGGYLSGDTMGYGGDDQKMFEQICRRWWKQYLKNNPAEWD